MYYDINAYNSISSDINFRGRNTPSENTTTVDYNGVDTNYNYNSYLESTSVRNNVSWNTDYTKTFEDNEEKEPENQEDDQENRRCCRTRQTGEEGGLEHLPHRGQGFSPYPLH